MIMSPERLKDILKDLPVWDQKYGDVLKRDVDQVIDEEVLLDEAVSESMEGPYIRSVSC